MFDLFKRRPKYWVTPRVKYYTLFSDMAQQPHLLIAGATGSGKSVVLNGIICTLLKDSPTKARFILLDPKGTELAQYANLPHTMRYAFNGADMVQCLQEAVQIMENRLQDMHKRGITVWDKGRLYVIIDEMTDLLLTMRKQAKPLLQRLCQLGRAAGVCCIGCCQNLLEKCLPTEIRCNFPAVVALKTATKQQSRFIAQRPGCETFPYPPTEHKALCYFIRGCLSELYNVPMYTAEQYNNVLDWWTSDKCTA